MTVTAASAPRLRGCSPVRAVVAKVRAVGPAPAGMFRGVCSLPGPGTGRPRACGDVPAVPPPLAAAVLSAPRLRGCSVPHRPIQAGRLVGPAPAGMFRRFTAGSHRPVGRPRACGDVPTISFGLLEGMGSAPRLRGCSSGERVRPADRDVGPAPAGMFRPARRCSAPCRSRPRACGDVPTPTARWGSLCLSAPRLRGCSPSRRPGRSARHVGPAPAGMFRRTAVRFLSPPGRPRACGNVPMASGSASYLTKSARACGDVPPEPGPHRDLDPVGPAPAGMFRACALRARTGPCRQRACGGAPVRSRPQPLSERRTPPGEPAGSSV